MMACASLPSPQSGRFPIKIVADTLRVARSNLVEQLESKTRHRGAYRRQGDDKLLAAIRQLPGVRPTYEYPGSLRC
jgi:putative transposase